MARVYSTYEAKSRFSEILREVRSGKRIRISYRGREVAEIRPVEAESRSLEEHFAELERQGVLVPAKRTPGALRPLTNRPGGLQRFLENRE
jgi:prevent-host-death family protein